MTEPRKPMEGAEFTGFWLQSVGEEREVNPICPECGKEIRLTGTRDDFRAVCGCDNPPGWFKIPAEDSD